MSRRNLANYDTFNTVYLNKLDIQTDGDGLSIYAFNSTTPTFIFNPVTGQATINGDLIVSGSGEFDSIIISELDSGVISLAAPNVSDLVDIGLSGQYDGGSGERFAGMVRDATDALKRFTFFRDILTQPVNEVIGLNSTKWSGVLAESIHLNDGSASTPSIAFDIDLSKDTGFYRAGENSIGITAGGEMVATISRTSGTLSNFTLNTDTILSALKINTVDDSVLSGGITTGHLYIESSSATDKWFKLHSASTAGTPAYAGTVFSSPTDYFFVSNVGSTFKIFGRTHSDAVNVAPDYRLANTEILSLTTTTAETKLPLVIPFGSLGSLALRFNSEATTGIYRSGANAIGIVGNGANILNVSDSNITASRAFYNIDGTVSLPSITFTNNTNMGLYRVSADTLGIAVAAANKITLNTTAITTTNGNIVNVGTSGTTSPLNVYGLATVYGGITSVNGQIVSVGTSGTSSSLNVYGVATVVGQTILNGVGGPNASSSSVYIAPATTTSTASDYYFTSYAIPTLTSVGAVTVPNAYTVYIAGAPAQAGSTTITTPYALAVASGRSYFGGQILASDGTVGAPSIAFVSDSGLDTGFYRIGEGNIGVSINGTKQIDIASTTTSWTTGHTVNIGTSGTTSILNVYGAANITKNLAITATLGGSVTAATSPLYIAPGSTAVTGSNNYYFTHYAIPATTGSTTGSAYTVYIDGAPSGTITTPYALYVAAGATRLANMTATTINASGLITASLGLTISNNTVSVLGAGSSTVSSGSLYIAPQSTTVTSSANYYTTYMERPTLTSGSAFTVPVAATLYVKNSPLAAGSTTITDAYSIYVESGNAYFGGSVVMNSGFSIANGQTMNIGTSGTTATLNIFGVLNVNSISTFTGVGSATNTISTVVINPASTTVSGSNNYYFTTLKQPATSGSTTGSAYTLFIEGAPTGTISNPYSLYVAAGVSLVQSLTTIGLITANAGINVTTGQTLNVGTSGNTSPLNVYGLITGNNGLTVSSGATSLQALTTNGLLSAVLGITITNGQTLNVGTSSNISPANIYGLISGFNGLTISSGATSLQATTTNGLLSAVLGITITTGQTLNVGTVGNSSPANIYGLITGSNGLTISSGATSLQATTTNGLLTAAAGLTVSNSQTANIGISGASTPLNVYGLITGANGLTISTGATSLQATTTNGLLTAAAGLTVSSGTTTLPTDLVFSADSVIRRNTSDGADNGFLVITGGGGNSTADRGAKIVMFGNEASGALDLIAGNVAGGLIRFYTGAQVERGTISTAGVWTLTTTIASTSSSTGVLVLSSGGLGIGTTTNATSYTNGGGITNAGGFANAGLAYFGSNVYVGTGISTNGERNIIIENTNTGTSAYSILRLRNNTALDGVIFLNGGNRVSDGTASGLTIRNDGGDVRLQTNGSSGSSLIMSFAGITTLNNSTASTSSSTGALVLSAGSLAIGNTTDSVSATNGGAGTIAGGFAITKTLRVGGAFFMKNGSWTSNGNDIFLNANSDAIYLRPITGSGNQVYNNSTEFAVANGSGTNFASFNHANEVLSLTGTGNTTATTGSFYVAPASTAVTGSNNYFFSSYAIPATTGSTTGIASTVYIGGAPSGTITSPYALYVGSGNSYFGGQILAASGTVSLPGYSFASDTGFDTGFYRIGEGNIGVTINGIKRIDIASTVTSWTTGHTVNIGTSSNTSPLNVYGLITGSNGISLTAGNLSLAGNIAFTASTAIRQSTTDGSDTNFISITGGGDIGPTRGGRIIVSGNERAPNAGKVQILAGDTGVIEFSTNNDAVRGTVNQSGVWTLNTAIASTSSSTGVLVLSLGGLAVGNTTDSVSATNGGAGTIAGGFAVGLTLRVGLSAYIGGQILASDGTVGAPGYSFASDTGLDTGFYRIGEGNIGITINGAKQIDIASTVTSWTTGHTVNIGTSSTTSPLNVYGLITGNNGLTISSGAASLQAVTANGLLTAAAGLTVSSGTTTLPTDLVFSADSVIRRNTSDGADNGFLVITGGGGNSTADRGAKIVMFGNEASGALDLIAGNVAGGTIKFYTGNQIERGSISTAGVWTIPYTTTLTGVGNTTGSAATFQVLPQTTTATASNYFFSNFAQPTLTSVGVVTVPNAYTIYVENAPAQAGSTTITNRYALYVAAGNSFFGGQILAASGTVSLPGYSFASDTGLNTGFYRIGEGNIGVAIDGVKEIDISATTTTWTDNHTINIGTSGAGNVLNVYGPITGYSGLNLSAGSVTIGQGGIYTFGSIYSDANWGMLFRARQSAPTIAEFSLVSYTNSNLLTIISSGNVGIGTITPLTRLSTLYGGGNDLSAPPYYNFGMELRNSTASGANDRSNMILFTDNNSTQAAIGAYRDNFSSNYLGGLLFLIGSQPGGYTLAAPTTITQASNSLTEAARFTPTGVFALTGTTASTSSTTGIMTLPGGLGISNTTNATSYTNGGGITNAGGFATALNSYLGGHVNIGTGNPIDADRLLVINNTSAGTGAVSIIRLQNGAGLGDSLMFFNGENRSTDGGVNAFTIRNNAGDLRLQVDGSGGRSIILSHATGITTLNSTTVSTSSSTGALVLSSGGLGISVTTDATSTTNGGACTIAGGLALAKTLRVGLSAYIGGQILAASGTVGAPGYSFASDTGLNTGFYLIGENNMGVSINGVKKIDIAATVTSWSDGQTVNIGTSGFLNLFNVYGNIANKGFDFILGNVDTTTRGDSGGSRALVKESGAKLIVNFDNDFKGGTEVRSNFGYIGGFRKGFAATNSTSITIDPTDMINVSYNIIECTAGTAVSVTLPTIASNSGREYVIIRSGAGTVTINTTSSQTIDDGVATSISLNAQYDRVTLICGSTQWYTV